MTVIKEMHVAKKARQRYKLSSSLFSYQGDLIIADYHKVQEITAQFNEHRPQSEHIASSELYAAGLLHEVQHVLIERFSQLNSKKNGTENGTESSFVARALHISKQKLTPEHYTQTLNSFLTYFPPTPVYQNELTPSDYLNTVDTNNSITGEELLILKLSNDNPALQKFAEFIDDSELKTTAYEAIAADIEQSVANTSVDIGGLKNITLSELLRNPISTSPHSLEGQLKFIEQEYAPHLGERFQNLFQKILLSLDLFKEEFTSYSEGLHGPPPMQVIDADMLSGKTAGMSAGMAAGMDEYEHFSSDSAWMPKLVLLAKSTYVWLDQLSKRYETSITTLDSIPEEELETFAKQGFTGLWLIGLWERSHASKEIKHRMGNPDAVASAYSLYDYEIAQDLGGTAAYEVLRDRAWQYGIRLASDMVPNHMGIDSRWVIEHPEWFLQTDQPPFPTYRFESENLSSDARASIKIEDHYYSKSDASVVFERQDTQTGDIRYIYHGNDGTSMPWNDTAQLNFLDPHVREAIIQTILHVARQFPIIRFDAAMTLAKRHIQRLWYPQPGSGGAIPSRAQYGSMTTDEFEEAIPEEFWREVVDRVAQEVPDTLLLAEAFWMMEGYFVRTLGMHRVYNSAFMHMLAQEDNAKYRQSMKNVLEFEPEILKRYVNFMNNPDEESAATQFGKGDKYFGVAMLMSTLPGLPMFGHGQFEGLEEKYGMEFRRASQDEPIDRGLYNHHYSMIVPLLKERQLFAEVENFQLYDFYTESGHVEENVYAYSNKHEAKAALILFNNQYSETKGWLKHSFKQASLLESLGINTKQGGFLRCKELVSALEYLRPVDDVENRGWFFELGPYDHRCYWQIQQVFDSEKENYSKLYATHGYEGIATIDTALQDYYYGPIQQAFIDLLKSLSMDNLSEENLTVSDAAYQHFLKAITEHSNTSPESSVAKATFTQLLNKIDKENPQLSSELQLAYLSLSQFSTEDITEWRCVERSEDILSDDEVALLRVLLDEAIHIAVPQVETGEDVRPVLRGWLEPLLFSLPAILYLRINEHNDKTYFYKESMESLCAALTWLDSLDAQHHQKANIAKIIKSAIPTSDYQVGKLLNEIYPKSFEQKKVRKHEQTTRDFKNVKRKF